MSRYIDADVLIDNVKKFVSFGKGAWNIEDAVFLEIDNTPTADVVEVVHGEWIVHEDGTLSCSVCNFKFYPIKFKYCPQCAARMDGGR